MRLLLLLILLLGVAVTVGHKGRSGHKGGHPKSNEHSGHRGKGHKSGGHSGKHGHSGKDGHSGKEDKDDKSSKKHPGKGHKSSSEHNGSEDNKPSKQHSGKGHTSPSEHNGSVGKTHKSKGHSGHGGKSHKSKGLSGHGGKSHKSKGHSGHEGPQCKLVTCNSHFFGYNQCRVPEAGTITSAVVVQKFSWSTCKYHGSPAPTNYNKARPGIYGYFRNILWVHSGCRAKFKVCFSEPDHCVTNPCKNGGVCNPTAAGYRCTCGFGWSGRHCTDRDICECSASGDPHYKTFDGQWIHFQGICTYLLAEAWHGTCGMIVRVKNKQSPRNTKVSLTRTMYVTVGSDKIVVHQNRKVTINEISHTFPYSTTDFTIYKNGQFIIIENKCGMKAMFNGVTTSRVIINKEDGTTATGLCGDCNGVEDDWRLKNGTDVRNYRNKYSLIGNSYVVEGDHDTEKSCTKEDEDILCSTEINEKIAKNEFCGYILDTSGPFKDCLGVVAETVAQAFYDSCSYDVCAYWGGATKQVCSALEAFADHCQTYGVDVVNFRTDVFCPPGCGANMVYNQHIADSQPSCKERNPAPRTGLPPSYGCVCKEGFVLDNAEETCVDENHCGCPTEDNYYSVGGGFVSEDCTRKYTCVNDGATSFLTEQALPGCSQNENCEKADGDRQCVCKDGFTRIDGICKDATQSTSSPPPEAPITTAVQDSTTTDSVLIMLSDFCDGESMTVDCDSWGFVYQACPIGDGKIINAKVIVRRSDSQCELFEGDYMDYDGAPGIFGFHNRVLWVYKGCRATFKVCYSQTEKPTSSTPPQPPVTTAVAESTPMDNETEKPPSPPSPQPPIMTTVPESTPMDNGFCDGAIITVDCDSWDFEYQACPVGDMHSIILNAKVTDRRSNSQCGLFEGYYMDYNGPPGIYGFHNNILWVFKGCRGTFEVCYSDDVCERLKPCKNGGSCTNRGNGNYECCCPEGWHGKDCGKEVQELPSKPPGPHLECINDLAGDPTGLMYFGTQDTTTSGRKCQAWASRYPHKHGHHDSLAEEGNNCRNRLKGKQSRYGPWCYTMDPNKKWEYCDNIPLCSNPNTTFPEPPKNSGCYNKGDKGESYIGPADSAASGKRCQTWPNYPDNYCRNPNGARDKPWCWTKDGKEDCDIDVCALPPPVPGENACTIDTFISLCESSVVLGGDCYYRHRLYQECDFTVVRNSSIIYEIYMPGVTKELHWQGTEPSRHINTNCGVTFEVTGIDELTIKYPVCGWCTKKSYESFMKDINEGTNTCPGI